MQNGQGTGRHRRPARDSATRAGRAPTTDCGGGDGHTVDRVCEAAWRHRLYGLLDHVAESHEPLQTAGRRHSAVLIGEDDHRAAQESLCLTRAPGMRHSILKGLKTPVKACATELDW
jgi:antitoxin YefM